MGAEHSTVALFGDMGVGSDDDSEIWGAYGLPCRNVSEAIARTAGKDANGNEDHEMLDAAFHFGDLSYAVGHIAVWDEFLHQISSTFTQKLPYATVVGNHEIDWFGDGWD